MYGDDCTGIVRDLPRKNCSIISLITVPIYPCQEMLLTTLIHCHFTMHLPWLLFGVSHKEKLFLVTISGYFAYKGQ